jgi:hypothetical protein
MNVTHLECALCAKVHEANTLQNLCTECGKPLLVRYDLERVSKKLTPESLAASSEFTLWRYRDVLPVNDTANIVSFGEGWTPLLSASEIAKTLPVKLNLYIKDEGTESDAVLQGSRYGGGDLDGKGTRRKESCRALGRQRGWCDGGICGACRNGSFHLHAI